MLLVLALLVAIEGPIFVLMLVLLPVRREK